MFRNDDGELGRGGRAGPARVDALEARVLTHVAAGDAFSLVVDEGGLVYSAGRNDRGQLGRGSALVTQTSQGASDGDADGDGPAPVAGPKLVRGLRGHFVVAVAAGARHALALTEGGAVYAWGDNKDGQLGNGTYVNAAAPIVVAGLAGKPVVGIAAGGAHSVAITATNALYVFGANGSGQLGLGDTTPRLRPTLNRFFANKAAAVGLVAAGDFHTVAVLAGGRAFGWGSSRWGQLGLGEPRDAVLAPVALQDLADLGPVVSLACGRRHTGP